VEMFREEKGREQPITQENEIKETKVRNQKVFEIRDVEKSKRRGII